MARAYAVLLSASLAACASSMKVETEFEKQAPFQTYKTWAPLPKEPGPEQAEVRRDPRIREAVAEGLTRGLASKGLARAADGQQPDLLVAVHGWATNRIEVNSYGYHYGPYGYYGAMGAMSTTTTDVRNYRDGTLIIDLIDAAKQELVWRGIATDTFQPGAEASTVVKAIDKTLGEYPPSTK